MSREDPFATHAREQAIAWHARSYAERLRWLEDAKRFAHLAQKAAAERRAQVASTSVTGSSDSDDDLHDPR